MKITTPRFLLGMLLLLVYIFTVGLIVPSPVDEVIVGAIVFYIFGR